MKWDDRVPADVAGIFVLDQRGELIADGAARQKCDVLHSVFLCCQHNHIDVPKETIRTWGLSYQNQRIIITCAKPSLEAPHPTRIA